MGRSRTSRIRLHRESHSKLPRLRRHSEGLRGNYLGKNRVADYGQTALSTSVHEDGAHAHCGLPSNGSIPTALSTIVLTIDGDTATLAGGDAAPKRCLWAADYPPKILMQSLAGTAISCRIPRYASVVWIEARPSMNWIYSSSPPFCWHRRADTAQIVRSPIFEADRPGRSDNHLPNHPR